MVRVVIDGEPVAKGRPRVTRAGRAYTPKRTADFEARVRDEVAALGAEALAGPLVVVIDSVRARPKRLRAARHGDDLLPAPTRPDVDNLAKAVLDGLDALWEDDAQVVELVARKWYAERDGEPRTEVEVRSWGA